MKPLLHISILSAAFAVVAPFLQLLPTQPPFRDFPPDRPKLALPVASNSGNGSCHAGGLREMSLGTDGRWFISEQGAISHDEIEDSLQQWKKKCASLGIRSNLRLRLPASMPSKHMTELIMLAHRHGIEHISFATSRRPLEAAGS